jgi:hypothetical protein
VDTHLAGNDAVAGKLSHWSDGWREHAHAASQCAAAQASGEVEKGERGLNSGVPGFFFIILSHVFFLESQAALESKGRRA